MLGDEKGQHGEQRETMAHDLADASCTSDESVAERKDALRRRMKDVRKRLGVAERERVDDAIARNLFATDSWQQAHTVFTYLSFGSEVDTRRIIEEAWRAGKTVALPRCVDGARMMAWHRVASLDGLVRSTFGVEEPPDDPATLIDPTATQNGPTIAIVPGLAFDPQGFRIGYGGGFYDAFLARFPGTTIGLCREAQLVPSLLEAGVLEEHDAPVHLVVSEAGVYSPH